MKFIMKRTTTFTLVGGGRGWKRFVQHNPGGDPESASVRHTQISNAFPRLMLFCQCC